jgi:hypothetical protein
MSGERIQTDPCIFILFVCVSLTASGYINKKH